MPLEAHGRQERDAASCLVRLWAGSDHQRPKRPSPWRAYSRMVLDDLHVLQAAVESGKRQVWLSLSTGDALSRERRLWSAGSAA